MKEKRKIVVLKQISSSIFHLINDDEFDIFEKITMIGTILEIVQDEHIRMRRQIEKEVIKKIRE